MLKRTTLPSQEELLSLFYYKDGGLYWAIDKSKKVKQHTKAGFVCKRHGYVFIRVNKILYREHRLIWKILKGVDPVEIDHINRIKTDNRIENLREVTRTENNLNHPVRVDNISGCTGVSWHKQKQRWRVYLKLGDIRKYLGSYKDLELACLVADAARDQQKRMPT